MILTTIDTTITSSDSTSMETGSISSKDTGLVRSTSTKRKSKNYKKNAIQLPKNLLQHCSS